MVVVEAHGEQFRKRIIGHETEFESCVSHTCEARHRGNVAADACLSPVTNVHTQVQTVVCVALAWYSSVLRLVLLFLFISCFRLYTSRVSYAEEVEIVDFVVHSHHPISANGLVDLYACGA